jgi:hypothetical protein
MNFEGGQEMIAPAAEGHLRPDRRASTRLKAGMAGGLWILLIASGIFAELFVRSTLIVGGDATATATNILASEQLFRLGIVADLVSAGAYIGTTLLLYDLFRPVNPSMSLFAALLGVAGSVIMIVNLPNLLGALLYLQDATAQAAFGVEQGQALAMLSLRFHALGYTMSIIVFAAHLLLLGCLVLRSTLLPRMLGALLVIACLCWWTNSVVVILLPSFAGNLYPYILLPSLVAEGGMALWLLVMGVNAEAWGTSEVDQ